MQIQAFVDDVLKRDRTVGDLCFLRSLHAAREAVLTLARQLAKVACRAVTAVLKSDL
jgi:hypothetical protein